MKYKTLIVLSLVILFQLLSMDVQAKYVDGKVLLLSGKEISCRIDLPIRAVSKNIRIKKEGSKSESISSDNIDQILLTSNGHSVLIKRTYVETIKLKGGTKKSKTRFWVEVQRSCENINSYTGIIGYNVSISGNLIGLTMDGIAAHYLQRPNEPYPTEVGSFMIAGNMMAIGFNKQRKKKLDSYFSNDKKTLDHFKSKTTVSANEIFDYIKDI